MHAVSYRLRLDFHSVDHPSFTSYRSCNCTKQGCKEIKGKHMHVCIIIPSHYYFLNQMLGLLFTATIFIDDNDTANFYLLQQILARDESSLCIS